VLILKALADNANGKFKGTSLRGKGKGREESGREGMGRDLAPRKNFWRSHWSKRLKIV